MSSNDNTNLYIIFASTPFRVGSFIRMVTKHKYNHAAITFDKDLGSWYSFARRYKNAPFYGGFVSESGLRYKMQNKYTHIKVCKLSLSSDDVDIIHNYIKEMKAHSNEYVYNMFSAFLFPFSKKLNINNAYTCVEFVVSVLSKVDSRIKTDNYYSIIDLENIYNDKLMYEGLYEIPKDIVNWEEDTFMEHRTFLSNTYNTILSLFKLTRLYFATK